MPSAACGLAIIPILKSATKKPPGQSLAAFMRSNWRFAIFVPYSSRELIEANPNEQGD
jgi:hypothetical protein